MPVAVVVVVVVVGLVVVVAAAVAAAAVDAVVAGAIVAVAIYDVNFTEINNIKNELSSTFGSNIKLNNKYDSSLIGGLIIKVGSTMIDTSIKNKLQQIEKKMIEA